MNTADEHIISTSGGERGHLWVGRDTKGRELEVIAVERPDCLLVIHAMPNYDELENH